MPHKDPEDSRAYFAAHYRANHNQILATNAKRYQENREAILAQAAQYRAAHRTELAEKERKRYAAKRDEIRTKFKQYAIKHREKLRAAKRAAYAANPAKFLTSSKASKQRHPELAINAQRRRRALKAHAPINDLTNAQWQTIQAHYKHCCAYCGKRAKRHLTQDHITPLSKGGSHTLHNVVPACRPCNTRKFNRSVLVPVQPLLL